MFYVRNLVLFGVPGNCYTRIRNMKKNNWEKRLQEYYRQGPEFQSRLVALYRERQDGNGR